MAKNYLVKYLGGAAAYPGENDGVLTIDEAALVFKGKRLEFKVPIEKIVDVATAQTDDMTKAVGSYLALGMLGVASTRSMSKNRTLKVSFEDQQGGVQRPEFRFLPRTIKEANFNEEAAAELNRVRRNTGAFMPKTDQIVTQPTEAPKPVTVTVEREIIREKIIIVKIRCSKCRGLFDETLDKCPHCGTENK
jgi:hypothetical protein